MDKKLIDRAWRILPAEFKRIVKAHYAGLNAAYKAYLSKDSLTNEECDRCKAMREKISIYSMYFGHHNLTSDAEGDVELLYVTRQKVMGLYANAKKLHDLYTSATCINEAESRTIDSTDGTISVLENLFGSKCLPDNVDGSEPNVDSSHDNIDSSRSNVDSLEQKPPEPKFKRCEKVITPSGEVCIIEDTHFENGCWLYLVGDPDQWVSESDLEPYTEPQEVAKIKPIEFKVSVYIATQEEDKELRQLLYENGFKWNGGHSLIDSSCWESDVPSSKIHFVYPDMTVTYSGERTEDTLSFSEFKKRYFGEDVNLSQESANCDKQFDTILKDSFSKDRRLNIAAMMAQAILTRIDDTPQVIADVAFRHADALIARAEEGDTK